MIADFPNLPVKNGFQTVLFDSLFVSVVLARACQFRVRFGPPKTSATYRETLSFWLTNRRLQASRFAARGLSVSIRVDREASMAVTAYLISM